jgi:hypothetical protein
MVTLLIYVLLHSPAVLVELSIDQSVFPERANNWDRIGLFKLKDGKEDRLVLMYYYDSDSVCQKMRKRHGFGVSTYPNCFDVHAVYQDGRGKWVHQEVIGYARVGFTRVVKAMPDRLILECRPKFRISVEPGKDGVRYALKRAEEINKPFNRSVSFENGKLVAK